MATKKNKSKISGKGGPSELQLITSLTRPSQGPDIAIDMSYVTSVYFNVDTIEGEPANTSLRASINGMEREDGSGHSWILKGNSIDSSPCSQFSGYYDSRTRRFVFTFC